MGFPAFPQIGWSSDRLKLAAGALPQALVRPPVVPGAGAPQQLNFQYTPPPVTPPPDWDTTPGTGHGKWQNPDWEALIRGDPGAQAGLGAIDANLSTANRARANAIKAAIVAFGGAPKSWASGYGDVDPTALAAAQENPFSTLKQLDRARSTSAADLEAALGARGMYSSGALTGGENLVQRNYEQATTDATQRLLDALGGYESQYGDIMRQSEGQRIGVLNEASSRVLAGNKATWVPDAPPVAPPVAVTPPGYIEGYTPERSEAEMRAGYEQSKASGGVPVKLPGGGVIYYDPSTGEAVAPPPASSGLPWWMRKEAPF